MRGRGQLLAVAIGLASGLPWLFRYSYTRGYDVFLWVYNGWTVGRQMAAGAVPDWTMHSAAGHPFFKIADLSSSLAVAAFMALGGTFAGLQIYVAVLYVLASLGMYRLAYRVTGTAAAASVAALAYVLSWFVSFTVYYQAYVSNFAIYALLPWFVDLLERGAQGRRLQWLGAVVLLAAAITTNPQVAIKLALLGCMWVLVQADSRDRLRASGTWCLAALALALWLAAFNVASALGLRDEVFTVGYRRTTFTGPWTLLYPPLQALNMGLSWLGAGRLVDLPLWQVLYSEYPGLVVVLLAAVALVRNRGRQARGLAAIAAVGYGAFFVVLPSLPSSEWIGSGHNVIVLPAFALSLLAGLGVRAAAAWSGRSEPVVAVVVAGALAVDLGGMLYGVNRWAACHLHPLELPEVRAWREAIAAADPGGRSGRLLSYNPDHTIYLYPVVTGRETANVIELRQRNPEFESYLSANFRAAAEVREGYRPSRSVALLDVDLLDLPSKLFTYVSPLRRASAVAYRDALALFDADPGLRRAWSRPVEAADAQVDPTALDPTGAAAPGPPGKAAQVLYRNEYRLRAFVPERVVAIAGDTRAGESRFEQIALDSTWYAPERVLYLLVPDPGALDARERAAIHGWMPAEESVPIPGHRLALADVGPLYAEPAREGPRVDVVHYGEKDLQLAIDPAPGRDTFLFVSLQRFGDWHAYGEPERPLPVRKAGAGLSAVFLPAGTRSVRMRYELPRHEWIGRGMSVVALALVLGLCRHWTREGSGQR